MSVIGSHEIMQALEIHAPAGPRANLNQHLFNAGRAGCRSPPYVYVLCPPPRWTIRRRIRPPSSPGLLAGDRLWFAPGGCHCASAYVRARWPTDPPYSQRHNRFSLQPADTFSCQRRALRADDGRDCSRASTFTPLVMPSSQVRRGRDFRARDSHSACLAAVLERDFLPRAVRWEADRERRASLEPSRT